MKTHTAPIVQVQASGLAVNNFVWVTGYDDSRRHLTVSQAWFKAVQLGEYIVDVHPDFPHLRVSLPQKTVHELGG